MVDQEDIAEADETEVAVNSLIWITSLGEAEQGVTDPILEDLEPYLNKLGIGFTRFEPRTRDDHHYFLDSLRVKAEGTFRPVIHLDMHGHADDGFAHRCERRPIWSNYSARLTWPPATAFA